MFIVALFTIVRRWKQSKCPSTDEEINKMWCIYVQWHIHSALKRNDILIHAITWMKLEDITPSKTRQTHKDKYCMSPLM